MIEHAPRASRTERDLLGTREVPQDAYWGIQTLRATENFQISRTPISAHPRLVEALAAVKQAAAVANREHGALAPALAAVIIQACEEIRAGALHDQFVVDVVQGGAGTSTNMNANEVIANRGLELLGRPRGDYAALHPNEHVNLSQSTNDVYPTALRIALALDAATLDGALRRLADALSRAARRFADADKLGRTQLQDAVPMTLGQELEAHAATVRRAADQLLDGVAALHEVNLGGTAIGTGATAPDGYAETACRELARLTGLPLALAVDPIAATQDAGDLTAVSGALRRVAVTLSKLANDLRLLSSGPAGGLGELRLPALQAGSSLMPGKVNPVIPELVNQIAFEVIGFDVTVTLAAEAGQLQLNAFLPIAYHALATGIAHLARGVDTLTERCVAGLDADRARMTRTLRGSSTAFVTTLGSRIGYEAASRIAAQAAAQGRAPEEIAREQGLIDDEPRDAVAVACGGGDGPSRDGNGEDPLTVSDAFIRQTRDNALR